MQGGTFDTIVGQQPVFHPAYLNLEYFFYLIYNSIRNFFQFFQEHAVLLHIITFLVCFFLIAVVVYSVLGIIRIWKHEWHELDHEAAMYTGGGHHMHGEEGGGVHEGAMMAAGTGTVTHADTGMMPAAGREWDRIIDYASSDNENDWRQAILEADIILDRLLDHLGYTGADLGEKLKGAQLGDFVTLDAAWEAHKVRNRIAHDGKDFILSRREAIRVLGLYEKVFREFDFI